MEQEKFKHDIVIQLPWTVPQQQNVQTLVIQQPAKTHMELNASTDKTAISSFALSVVIALALGGLATWLAYWYGRKSFDLTKQSFDAVIKQIESSEKIALDINKRLIDSQFELKEHELKFLFKGQEIDKLRNLVAEYFTHIVNFNSIITMDLKAKDKGFLIRNIVEYNSQVINYHVKLELFLDSEDNINHKRIKENLNQLLLQLWEIRKVIDQDEKFIREKISDFDLMFDVVRKNLVNLIVDEIKIQKGD